MILLRHQVTKIGIISPLPQVEDGNLVNLEMLTRLLEDELELEVRSGTTSRPLLRLAIQAFLLEVSSLRSQIANLESEREKLRSDVAEANQRSAIMAQEIDDQVGVLKNPMYYRVFDSFEDNAARE